MPKWSSWHDYLDVESVIIMITRIDANQPKKANKAHLMLATATGAAMGMGSRYLVPTKAEMKSLGSAADTFFSNAATTARGANRSMLKYGAIGALAAGTIALLAKLFTNKKQETPIDSFEYSRIQAIVDAPDSIAELYLYGDK